MTIYPLKYCVYHHKIGKRIFYVGAGVSSRPFVTDDRTEAWRHFIKNNGGSYQVKIVAWFNTQNQARRFEAREIQRVNPLTNGGWTSRYWTSRHPIIPTKLTIADRKFIRLLIKG